MSCRAAARRYEVSESTAIKWLERYRRDGLRGPVGHGGHRASKLMPHREFPEAARAEKSDLTLQKLCDRDERLFLSVTPIRRRNRLIIEVSALTPFSERSRGLVAIPPQGYIRVIPPKHPVERSYPANLAVTCLCLPVRRNRSRFPSRKRSSKSSSSPLRANIAGGPRRLRGIRCGRGGSPGCATLHTADIARRRSCRDRAHIDLGRRPRATRSAGVFGEPAGFAAACGVAAHLKKLRDLAGRPAHAR